MTGLPAIRQGVADALTNAFGHTAQIVVYPMSSPMSPGFEIDLSADGVSYDQSFGRGIDEWNIIVRGFVALTTDRGAQIKRDEWLTSTGASSVKTALETDKTLGGAVNDIQVTSAVPRDYVSAASPNTVYLGAEWRLRVLAPGTSA